MMQETIPENEVQVWLARGTASHVLRESVLVRYVAAPLEFAVGPQGKPYLANAPHLRFNTAHSGDVVLIAVAFGVEVGVDVERLRPLPDCVSVAQRFFAPDEFALFLEVPTAEREREFFERWTRTEAVLKARGVGLLGDPAAVDGDWSIARVDAGPGYAAAVAAARKGMQIRMR
jgi:4'-phosphopantetheinyl transferase